MTGIERLRELADAEKANGYATVSRILSDIADQIEREHAKELTSEHVTAGKYQSRCVALENAIRAAICAMERHVLGVEGMDDSPVARWARELREALGGREDEEVTDVATIRKDAMEAWRWAREHGGIEGLRRMFRDADNRRVELCAALGIDLDKGWSEAMAVMRLRLMPEGTQWPCFKDGEPVCIGDKFECWCGEEHVVGSVTLREGCSVLNESQSHSFVVSDGPFTAHGKRVKRPEPKVLDADGVEIRVGDTVWHVHDLDKFTVTNSNNGENLSVSCMGEDGKEYCCYPTGLTHRAPVLAADGKPLREGEHVWHVETGTELVVKELPKPGAYQAVVVFAPPASHLTSFDPDQLTHERPDSWERLEDDAKKAACDYFWRGEAAPCNGCPREHSDDCTVDMAIDLVRRAKALAERDA